MSSAPEGRTAAGPAPSDRAPEAAANESAADTASADTVDRALAAWDAARALLAAARGFIVALIGLARSEWDLARASIPWVIAYAIVMVGLALSLWMSVVALTAWVLFVFTGSLGLALLGLVVLHLLGLTAVVWALKRNSRRLTMPATRAEVQGLLARARHSSGRAS